MRPLGRRTGTLRRSGCISDPSRCGNPGGGSRSVVAYQMIQSGQGCSGIPVRLLRALMAAAGPPGRIPISCARRTSIRTETRRWSPLAPASSIAASSSSRLVVDRRVLNMRVARSSSSVAGVGVGSDSGPQPASTPAIAARASARRRVSCGAFIPSFRISIADLSLGVGGQACRTTGHIWAFVAACALG